MALLCFNQLIAYYSPGPRLETWRHCTSPHCSRGQAGAGVGILLILFSDYTRCKLQTSDVVTALYTTEVHQGQDSISSGVRFRDVFPAALQRDTIALM